MELKITTHSAKKTQALGEKLGRLIKNKCVIAFFGGMGSGKTCITHGICKGLDFSGDVTSPTFAIVNEYLGGRLPVFHFDMYRISDEDELYGIGFYDYLDQNAICVIEWSENIKYALPPDSIFISFESVSDTCRNITINYNEKDFLLKELVD